MAEIKGRITLNPETDLVSIEFPERAASSLLRSPDFSPEPAGHAGIVGTYRGIPVTLRRRKRRA